LNRELVREGDGAVEDEEEEEEKEEDEEDGGESMRAEIRDTKVRAPAMEMSRNAFALAEQVLAELEERTEIAGRAQVVDPLSLDLSARVRLFLAKRAENKAKA